MNYSIDIYSLLKDFYNISGIRVSIHDTEFNEIYSYPHTLSPYCKCLQENPSVRKACEQDDAAAFRKVRSSGEVFVYKCNRGLYEAVAPIYHYGVISGYIMLGQIRSFKDPSVEFLQKKAYKIIGDAKKAEQLAQSVQAVSREKLYSYINLMTVIAGYITGQNKLRNRNGRLSQQIYEYLNKNYSEKITLDGLSQKFGCCKSTLAAAFKEEYKIPVMQYLNNLRLDIAAESLSKTFKSLKEISADCGFYDQNHFSKAFLKHYGCLPSVYRKNHNK